ncbi:SGNH/GDSL hydrolase family protein [Methylomonas sp. AM2-LC]|uniref:SGNH/GDSL hydrolase family protein n=1 Tax=Methylomonas sp. AM2-LC TaxID=3153301 RepID=UPI003264A1F7
MKILNNNIQILLGLFFAATSFLANACENQDKKNCIVFVGNSITQHGSWGMAASSKDKDFSSQLLKRLSEKYNTTVWEPYIRNIYTLEKDPLNFKLDSQLQVFARNADFVIVELGDNFDSKTASISDFSKSYLNLLASLQPTRGILACVSTWWSSPEKDGIIRENCKEVGGIFVDISDLGKHPENIAKNERDIKDPGVGIHPGDKGMKAIADRIYEALN